MSQNKYKFTLDTAEMNDSHMGLVVKIKPEQRILELGCSSGYLSKFLKQELDCYVVGVDIDAFAAKQAEAYCDQIIVTDLDCDDWLAYIKGQQFDVVLCADVLEHLKNPVAMLAGLKPFLHAESLLLASVPNIAHASIRLELLQGNFDYEPLGIMDDTHLHFYTRNSLISMLMQAGYVCSDIAYSVQDLADEAINLYLEKAGLNSSKAARELLHKPDAVAYQFIIEARPAKTELVQNLPLPLSPKPLVSSGVFYGEKQEKIESLERQLRADKKHIHQLEKSLEIVKKQLDDEKEHNKNHQKNIHQFEGKLEIIGKQGEVEREHNKNHQKNIRLLEETLKIKEQQRDAEEEHNKNHQKNIRLLEETLKIKEQQRDAEEEHNNNHQKNIVQLEEILEIKKQEIVDELQHNKNHQKTIEAWCETTSVLDNALFDLTEQIKSEREKNAVLNANVSQLQERSSFLYDDTQRLEQVLSRVHRKVSYRMIRGVKGGIKTIKGLFLKPLRRGKRNKSAIPESQQAVANGYDYAAWLDNYGEPTEEMVNSNKVEIASWQNPSKIAILMPVYNPEKACLVNAIESVLQQLYINFELCIADDASTESYVRKVLESYVEKDKRIKVIFREQNGHISAASNSALSLVEADYVALMDHDDLLTPDALFWVAKAIKQYPDAELIYSDEDKMDIEEKRYAPYFKPDWNPELFLSHNFICHLGIYKTTKVKALGGFESEFDGAQDYDLALRYLADTAKEQIIHIPRILYHWRAVEGSTANGVHEKPYAEALIKKAVERALQQKQRPAEVLAHDRLPGALRVRYLLPDDLPLVSIVIPTRNGFDLLRRCVESIFSKTKYKNYELIIIDNASDDLVALRYLQHLSNDSRVTIIRDESPFNYAALNNKAVEQAKGEVIALLNNDLEVINDDWLDEMVSHVMHPEAGAVGAKLYYPDDTIQHAGVIVGLGGVAGHSHKHSPRENPGFCGRLLLTQNLSAVTAACMLVRKEVFNAVGGFDEQNLSVAFNDIDLCLRIKEQGFLNVWTPYAEMYHYESASRGYEDTPEKQARFNKEVAYMKKRWGEGLLVDPAYNPNLTLDREDFSFAFPPQT